MNESVEHRAAANTVAYKPSTTLPGQGALVAGAYRAGGILVRGPHHMLVAATHAQLGTRVVLELAWPKRIDSATVARFMRDARAASTLRSRHVARVLDVGVLDDGGFYVASEHVDGEDLRSVLAHRGSTSAHEAARLIVEVCEAVAELHAHDIVHRELELANLKLTRDHGVKVINAGCMMPLLRVPLADARTDIFALGRMLFELVTGQSPLVAGVGLLRERAHVPARFASIVERCLAPDAALRFQHVEELAAALAPFAVSPQNREAPAFSAANVVAVEVAHAADEPATAPRRRGGLIVGLVLLALGIGAGFALDELIEPPAALRP